MRTRNFLLVHSSRSIRAMIQKYILADLGDVIIVESDNGKDALIEVSNNAFDLVICDSDLMDMPVSDFRRAALESSKNSDLDFIILSGSNDEMVRLANEGFQHIVNLPFNPEAFVGTINQICNPRQWRQAERFHIPNSKAIISVWGMEAEAVMINISRGGVLVEVSGDRSELLLQNNPKLTLIVNVQGEYHDIKGLPAKLARLNATEWNHDFKPTVMRVAYIFNDLDQDTATQMEHVLQMAAREDLVADEE